MLYLNLFYKVLIFIKITCTFFYRLQRVTDTKYGKMYPAYKLMSTSDILSAETKTTNAKTLKKLPINVRITDHDLKTKTQTIKKWLMKNCEVHVAIARNNEMGSLAVIISQKVYFTV